MAEPLDLTVRRFTSDFTNVALEGVTLNSALVEDLGVDGDDGVDFIVQFADRFQVDLSGFNASDYFDSEGLPLHAPFVWFLQLVTLGRLPRREEKMGIEVEDLVAAAKRRKWSQAA